MTPADLAPLIDASSATEAFRTDVLAYAQRQPATRVSAPPGNPRVKVLRAIAQLLHTEPRLTVDRVSVHAISGCADYVGSLTAIDASGETHHFDFAWNCEWKAREMGYVDGFGFPDQIRAAQEFDWRCFQRWARVESHTPSTV